MTSNPQASVPTTHLRFFDYTYDPPEVFPNNASTILDEDDMLKSLLCLGTCIAYPDTLGGPAEAHCRPLMEITVQEFRVEPEELAEGTSAYASLQNIHPTDPSRGPRIPNYVRGYEESLDTQYYMGYFRTQPEYALYQLLWETVMGQFGLPRPFLSPLRHIGAGGDTLHLSVAYYYHHHTLLIPIDDAVTTQSLRSWAHNRFE